MKKRDRLVLDNLSVHKVKTALKPLVDKGVKDKGVKIEFLPSYSQDMNPIENAWFSFNGFAPKDHKICSILVIFQKPQNAKKPSNTGL